MNSLCPGEIKTNQKWSRPFLGPICDFWAILSVLSSPWGVLPTGACGRVSRAFLGLLGARTSTNLMEAQCLVDGKAQLISNSDSSSSPVRASLYEISPQPLWFVLRVKLHPFILCENPSYILHRLDRRHTECSGVFWLWLTDPNILGGKITVGYW